MSTYGSRNNLKKVDVLQETLFRSVASGGCFKSVLDVGCGTGLLGSIFLKSAEKMLFLDVSQMSLDQLREKTADAAGACRVSFFCGDISELPQKDFDLILFLLSLHHIDDWKGALKGAAERLSPDGKIVICDLIHEFGMFHLEKVSHNGFCPYAITGYLRDSFSMKCESLPVSSIIKDEKEYSLFLLSCSGTTAP